MESYRNIVVPLDGSAFAEAILPEVENLAGMSGTNVSLLRIAHVYRIEGTNYIKHEADIVREAEEYLSDIERGLRNRGLSVDSHVRYGAHPAEEILNHANEYDVDLIMMSTHGHTGLTHTLLGSVAEKVLHHTKKPLLLVRRR